MRILLLAPHPFFIERGTPIDVLLVLRGLSQRPATHVDLVTYQDGSDVELPQVTVHRSRDLRVTRNTKPGFSLKKVVADVFLSMKAWSLMRRHRYDLVHAGEESVFLALVFKHLYGVPYVYDLDSSIAQQLVESMPFLRPFSPVFDYLETVAIRQSVGCLPVCNALAELCERKGARFIETLHDISQLKEPDSARTGWLLQELGLAAGSRLVLYSGNMEGYQGVELLIRGFAMSAERDRRLHLVIIGGTPKDIHRHRRLAEQLGAVGRVHFLGPKPFDQLHLFLAEADIAACPRTSGINTPMKIFPYLHSGTALLATRLYSHTQILTDQHALLVDPSPDGIARGLLELAADEGLRRRLGAAGRELVERNHTFDAYRTRLHGAYDRLEREVLSQTA